MLNVGGTHKSIFSVDEGVRKALNKLTSKQLGRCRNCVMGEVGMEGREKPLSLASLRIWKRAAIIQEEEARQRAWQGWDRAPMAWRTGPGGGDGGDRNREGSEEGREYFGEPSIMWAEGGPRRESDCSPSHQCPSSNCSKPFLGGPAAMVTFTWATRARDGPLLHMTTM